MAEWALWERPEIRNEGSIVQRATLAHSLPARVLDDLVLYFVYFVFILFFFSRVASGASPEERDRQWKRELVESKKLRWRKRDLKHMIKEAKRAGVPREILQAMYAPPFGSMWMMRSPLVN